MPCGPASLSACAGTTWTSPPLGCTSGGPKVARRPFILSAGRNCGRCAAYSGRVSAAPMSSCPSELLLGVFVTVEAQLGIEWKVGAELQKERAEVAIHRVDVIVVHHGGGAHNPWIGQAGDRAPALLGAEHRRLF